MTRAQRRTHALLWATLTLLFALAAAWSMWLRASRPLEPIPQAIADERGIR